MTTHAIRREYRGWSASADRTSPMTVNNMGFLLDRLGADCAPLQFIRELTVNAIEAIEALPRGDKKGQIHWEYDRKYFEEEGIYKLSIVDTGIGMSGGQMVELINRLSSSGRTQSIDGNFGVGAKIAAATRNRAGVVYLSWTADNPTGAMIHLWRDASGQYGLKQQQLPDGTYEYWAPIQNELKPDIIKDHGTIVTLLGNDDDEDTMKSPVGVATPSKWVARYLNSRFYSFPSSIVVKAREGWESEKTDTTNIMREVKGAKHFLELYKEKSGTVNLTDAVAYWWILKDTAAVSQSSGIALGGLHTAALHKNELYDLAMQRAAIVRLQSFGVTLGYQRVVIYVRPNETERLTTNTSRTSLLLANEPLPWGDWAEEFRRDLPKEIKDHIELTAGEQDVTDYQKSIKERLKEMQDLYRLKKYRPAPKGQLMISDELLSGEAEREDRDRAPRRSRRLKPGAVAGTRAGSLYTRYLAETGGRNGEQVRDRFDDVRVVWVSETELGYPDRAAAYDGQSHTLQINKDFRVFVSLIEFWSQRLKDKPGSAPIIEAVVREWFEQTLREVVYSIEFFRGQKEWSGEPLSTLTSPEALTAAVLPRYNLSQQVGRVLGSKLGALNTAKTA